MITALYRKSSGEVRSISTAGNLFEEDVDEFVGVAIDISLTNGSEVQNPNGDYRVLGYAKFNDSGTIRNAVQNEIDTFYASEIDDYNQKDANKAKEYFQNNPEFRRIITALSDIFVDEFNLIRTWTRSLKTEIAASTSLSDFQTRVASLSTLNDRTLSQLKTAILNRISKDD